MTDYTFYNQILTRLAANHPGTLDEKTTNCGNKTPLARMPSPIPSPISKPKG